MTENSGLYSFWFLSFLLFFTLIGFFLSSPRNKKKDFSLWVLIPCCSQFDSTTVILLNISFQNSLNCSNNKSSLQIAYNKKLFLCCRALCLSHQLTATAEGCWLNSSAYISGKCNMAPFRLIFSL